MKIQSNLHLNRLAKKNEDSRLKYKPAKIKYLIIAEAPPDSIDRFFYYPYVPKADYLFLGVISVLYPGEKEKYLSLSRNPEIKKSVLEKFKNDGFYLVDLLPVPKSLFNNSWEDAAENLIAIIKNIIGKGTKIILIKTNVYDLLFPVLRKEEFDTIDVRINFPASGNQKKFYSQFRSALYKAGYLK